MAHAVWPYQSGEVVVQNYNTLLTLATLQQSCDGVIFHRNSVVNELLKARYSLKNVAFSDVNAFVARELASVLLPAKDASGALHKMPIFQLIGDLCSHPAFKSLSIRSLPQIRNKRDGFLVSEAAFCFNRTSFALKLSSANLFLKLSDRRTRLTCCWPTSTNCRSMASLTKMPAILNLKRPLTTLLLKTCTFVVNPRRSSPKKLTQFFRQVLVTFRQRWVPGIDWMSTKRKRISCRLNPFWAQWAMTRQWLTQWRRWWPKRGTCSTTKASSIDTKNTTSTASSLSMPLPRQSK